MNIFASCLLCDQGFLADNEHAVADWNQLHMLEDAPALSKKKKKKTPPASSPRPSIHAGGKAPTCCQWKHKG